MKLVCILLLLVGLAFVCTAGSKHPHAGTIYIVLDAEDVTAEMLELTPMTAENIPTSADGMLAILKWIVWEEPPEVPPVYTNDVPISDKVKTDNKRLKNFKWAHKKTPQPFRRYKQYTNTEITERIREDDWTYVEPTVTNAP